MNTSMLSGGTTCPKWMLKPCPNAMALPGERLRRDLVLVQRGLVLVVDQNHDDVGLPASPPPPCGHHAHRLWPRSTTCRAAVRRSHQRRFFHVERVGVTLAAVADHRHFFAAQRYSSPHRYHNKSWHSRWHLRRMAGYRELRLVLVSDANTQCSEWLRLVAGQNRQFVVFPVAVHVLYPISRSQVSCVSTGVRRLADLSRRVYDFVVHIFKSSKAADCPSAAGCASGSAHTPAQTVLRPTCGARHMLDVDEHAAWRQQIVNLRVQTPLALVLAMVNGETRTR